MIYLHVSASRAVVVLLLLFGCFGQFTLKMALVSSETTTARPIYRAFFFFRSQ